MSLINGRIAVRESAEKVVQLVVTAAERGHLFIEVTPTGDPTTNLFIARRSIEVVANDEVAA